MALCLGSGEDLRKERIHLRKVSIEEIAIVSVAIRETKEDTEMELG